MPRGPKREKRPADVIGNAIKVAGIATGEGKTRRRPSIRHTPREGRFRLISARRATKDEQEHYFTQNIQGET